jgi:hypothetical protein
MKIKKPSEPRCVLNHDMLRRKLRDENLSEMDCPSCGWHLKPAKPVEPPSEDDGDSGNYFDNFVDGKG